MKPRYSITIALLICIALMSAGCSIGPKTDPSGRAQNRRVEIEISPLT